MGEGDLIPHQEVKSLSGKQRRNWVTQVLEASLAAGASAIPYAGSSIASLIQSGFEAARKRRIDLFLDEVDARLNDLNEEKIGQEDFVQAFTSSAKAAAATQQDEKIKLFAHLFTTFVNGETDASPDEYEEALRILDDLSVREFQILLTIRDHQKTNAQSGTNYITGLIDRIEKECGINIQEIPGALARLTRTGLYQTSSNGGQTFFDHRGIRVLDFGFVTPNLDRFLQNLGIAQFREGTDLSASIQIAPLVSNQMNSIADFPADAKEICFSVSADLSDQEANDATERILKAIGRTGIPFVKPDPQTGLAHLGSPQDYHRCKVMIPLGTTARAVYQKLRQHPEVVDIWLPEKVEHEESDYEEASRLAPHLARILGS